jgi:hypothetical protein
MTSKNWDRDKFLKFLSTKGLKYKVCKDHLYRCERIERLIKVDLVEATKNEEEFRKLIPRLSKVSKTVCQNDISSNTMVSVLMGSARKFAEFKYGLRTLSYKKNMRIALVK